MTDEKFAVHTIVNQVHQFNQFNQWFRQLPDGLEQTMSKEGTLD
jgi:hypothetical protein